MIDALWAPNFWPWIFAHSSHQYHTLSPLHFPLSHTLSPMLVPHTLSPLHFSLSPTYKPHTLFSAKQKLDVAPLFCFLLFFIHSFDPTLTETGHSLIYTSHTLTHHIHEEAIRTSSKTSPIHLKNNGKNS